MGNNPFLTKIIYEQQLCENEKFGIVPDAEPMIEGHYLFYLKEYMPSVSDCDIPQMVQFVERTFPKYVDNTKYAYFERGRASFCTSMNGVIHGHGHLVPAFMDNMSALFPYGTEKKFRDMKSAYESVPKTGQYLLWGNLGEEFYLLEDVVELPKRIIRHTIERYHNVEIK